MRVLFVIPHHREGASSRYRVLQYVPHLEAQGIRCTVSPFLSSEFHRIAYQQGGWGNKIGQFLLSSCRRLRDVMRSGSYDVVFIHLEAFPLGPPVIEWFFSLRGVPIVFDLDDALFLPRDGTVYPMLKWLRMPQKIPAILRWSRCVITTNDHLRTYAQQFNAHVSVIPTCVDIRQFTVPMHRPQRARPLLGWVGSHSTAPYLELVKPVLARLAERYAFTFRIVGSLRPFRVPGVEVIQVPWSLANEVTSFQELDVGVYPLPTAPWVLGKAGFKAIQYMAVGVPCVASDVGRNREIIQDGVNGLLASSQEEWYAKLAQLLTDPLLCQRISLAGRKTVEERFANHLYVSSYVEILHGAARSRARRATVSAGGPQPPLARQNSPREVRPV